VDRVEVVGSPRRGPPSVCESRLLAGPRRYPSPAGIAAFGANSPSRTRSTVNGWAPCALTGSTRLDHEIQLINDGDGIAVIGDATDVERFLAAEGLPSKELGGPDGAARDAADDGRDPTADRWNPRDGSAAQAARLRVAPSEALLSSIQKDGGRWRTQPWRRSVGQRARSRIRVRCRSRSSAGSPP